MNVLPTIIFSALAATLVMGLIRLLIGPRLPDRIVALELISVTVVGFIVVYAITTERSAFLDAATAVALIGFLGTVAVARYLERRAKDD